jgi:hypothetical protein
MLEECVLILGVRLRRSPIAVPCELAGIDELASVGDGPAVDVVAGHLTTVP